MSKLRKYSFKQTCYALSADVTVKDFNLERYFYDLKASVEINKV